MEDRRELKPSHPDRIQILADVEQAHPDGTRYKYDFPAALEDALRTGFDILMGGVPPIREIIVRFIDLIVYMHLEVIDGQPQRFIGDVQRVMGVAHAGKYVLETVA